MSLHDEQMLRYRQEYIEPSKQITRTTHTIQTEQLEQPYTPAAEATSGEPEGMTTAERRDAVRKSFRQT